MSKLQELNLYSLKSSPCILILGTEDNECVQNIIECILPYTCSITDVHTQTYIVMKYDPLYDINSNDYNKITCFFYTTYPKIVSPVIRVKVDYIFIVPTVKQILEMIYLHMILPFDSFVAFQKNMKRVPKKGILVIEKSSISYIKKIQIPKYDIEYIYIQKAIHILQQNYEYMKIHNMTLLNMYIEKLNDVINMRNKCIKPPTKLEQLFCFFGYRKPELLTQPIFYYT